MLQPRVARASQPWAERCNPFGIARLAILVLVWLASIPASGLILSGRGNQEVRDAGWPAGALALANFESRIGWWEGPPFGGGEWHFLFSGNTEGFQDALALFAAIRAPVLDLVIHDGPYEDSLLKERVDWAFTVWVPANWHRLFNNPKSVSEAGHPHFRRPVDPPRLDVYVGGGGGVDWAKLKVPAGLNVRDERAAAAHGATNPPASDAGHIAWVECCLRDFASIKPNMTREEVEGKFKLDGGLQSASPVRFTHPACPYFKIAVEFDFKRDGADQGRAVSAKDDKVIRVSKPYLEAPVRD